MSSVLPVFWQCHVRFLGKISDIWTSKRSKLCPDCFFTFFQICIEVSFRGVRGTRRIRSALSVVAKREMDLMMDLMDFNLSD